MNSVTQKADALDIAKGAFAGAVAGLAASFVMNQFQMLLSSLMEREEKTQGAQSQQQGAPEHGIGKYLEDRGASEPDDTAPERLASAVAELAFGTKLSNKEKAAGGTLFHYTYGTSMAAVYGAAAEIVPDITAGLGWPYGGLVWLGADEGVVPLIGLSKSPLEYPLSTHAYALASHLVYGATTECVRRAVKAVI